MENQKTIYIIGAGAIGKALAIALKTADRNVNVIVLRASVAAVEQHEENIRLGLPDKTEISAKVKIASLNHFPKLDGIIVLTNKSYGNEHLSSQLKNKTGNSPIVLLQNGLGVEDIFVEEQFPKIYRCVLFATSQLADTNKVNFKPVSPSHIGIIKGDGYQLSEIVHSLNTRIFPFQAVENIQKTIWRKAITNCVFNSICPLIETDNGIFHRDTHALNIAKRIIDECLEIANSYKIELSQQEVLDGLLMISKLSDGQLISSYQDIIHKRPTEIDTLNFAIVKMAEAIGKADSVKETKLLGELTKLKSDISRMS